MKPEMSAYEVTEKVVDAIESKKYNAIILLYIFFMKINNWFFWGKTNNFKKRSKGNQIFWNYQKTAQIFDTFLTK